MTILLVDDDPKQIKYLSIALTNVGYSVLTADNAKAALSILIHTPVNLIITDILMPDMNGHEFCLTVRSEPEFEYIPIIVLSALSSVDDVATSMIAGADEYLSKPIRFKDLLEKIEEYAM